MEISTPLLVGSIVLEAYRSREEFFNRLRKYGHENYEVRDIVSKIRAIGDKRTVQSVDIAYWSSVNAISNFTSCPDDLRFILMNACSLARSFQTNILLFELSLESSKHVH